MGWFFTFLIVFFDEQNFLILMNYNLFYSSVSYTFGIISKNPLRNPRSWKTDAKNWLIRKDPDAGKDWRQEEKGTTEYEMVGWHHWLNGHEFEQAPGVGDGQGSLACCSPWGHKELDTTAWLNWTEASLSFTISMIYSNSYPLSFWCYPTISSSVVPFSSCLQSFPASGFFPRSQFFASGGQSIGASASASVLLMNIQECFPLEWKKVLLL